MRGLRICTLDMKCVINFEKSLFEVLVVSIVADVVMTAACR